MWWVLLLVLGLLGMSYCYYWIAFYNPESRHAEAVTTKRGKHRRRAAVLSRELDEIPSEEIWITSRDGLRLRGRYYHVKDDAPLHIQFHGYRGNAARDLGAANHVARSLGYNTLVVDQRAHGLSQGDTMTFGIMERWDCLAWAEYAVSRFGGEIPIFLYGISMGAATVLMAAELPLPQNVIGIIGDCPYSSPVEILRKISADVHFPAFLSVPFGIMAASLWGGFRLSESSAMSAVQNTDLPVLLIHGKEDRYILPEMSRQIQAKCRGKCFLELFPGAAHGGSCLTDTKRYRMILEAFVNDCLKEKTEDN